MIGNGVGQHPGPIANAEVLNLLTSWKQKIDPDENKGFRQGNDLVENKLRYDKEWISKQRLTDIKAPKEQALKMDDD